MVPMEKPTVNFVLDETAVPNPVTLRKAKDVHPECSKCLRKGTFRRYSVK